MPVLQEGQLFERYRIQRLLGISASGESYQTEDTMLLRQVTLKLIHPWATLLDSGRRQFFRDLQSISILNHPYLAPVLDFGEFNSRLYVARRFSNSGTLSGNEGRLWFTPPLDTADAIHYIQQLAQALQHIHNHGYVHGSLTFSNILVMRDPSLNNDLDHAPLLISDAGLANFVRRFGHPQNQLLPIAAAPEQYTREVTATSDQFALAILLYFWLTGCLPFLGTPQEIEHQKRTETIAPPSSLNPRVTFEQEGILLRALSAYPEDRYPSVLAFADTLLATLAPLPQAVPAGEPTPQPELTAPIESTTLEDEPQSEAFNSTDEATRGEAQGLDFVAPASSPDFTIIPETDSILFSELEAGMDSLIQAEPAPAAAPTPTPQPAPVPKPEPDIPQPISEPDVPQPAPDPIPTPRPDIPQTPSEPDAPQPTPDPIPQPAPDVPQPLPEPNVPQTPPQTLPQAELAGPENLSAYQELLPPIQPEQTVTVPRLIIISPYTQQSSEIRLESDEITLGRAGSSDILLDQDNLTSRHHALLKRKSNTYIIYDRRSAKGVFVNGQKIEIEVGCELANGDHISIGNYELIFRLSPIMSVAE